VSGLDQIRFRRASSLDSEPIARLHADSWRRHYRGAYSDSFLDGDVARDRLAVWTRRLAAPDPGSATIVAERHGALVGFAHTRFEDDATWGALLDNLHVAHGLKRQGTGTRLLGANPAPMTCTYWWHASPRGCVASTGAMSQNVDVSVQIVGCVTAGSSCCPDGTACPPGQSCCSAGTGSYFCANFKSDSYNCGACGNACHSTETCVLGQCTNEPTGQPCSSNAECASGYCANDICCPAGTTNNCSGVCVNEQTDPNNCGSCGHVCPTAPNSTTTCTSGTRGTVCITGYGNCNGLAADGCEGHLQSDAKYFGTCGYVGAAGVDVGIGVCTFRRTAALRAVGL